MHGKKTQILAVARPRPMRLPPFASPLSLRSVNPLPMSPIAPGGASSSSSSFAGSYDPHWALYPRTYLAPRIVSHSFVVDGNLDKHPWNNDTLVPWSDPFGDIQRGDVPVGSDDGSVPMTRFKSFWDDNYLYVAAALEPASWLPTEVHFARRNSPIYQMDSDFEVFVDPPGRNFDYKELEINAINTVWNLLLDKPYGDGGQEHSGRVAEPGEPLYWDVSDQKTATRVVDGLLNDPDGRGAYWTVELALSFRDLHDRCGPPEDRPVLPSARVPRRPTYRINFSRVEADGDFNWTWQPQVVWDPKYRRHIGKINMHLPDAWGYLVLGDGDDDEATAADRDATWPHRLAAMNVYYALHYYKESRGAFTTHLEDLNVDRDIVQPFEIRITTGTDDQGVDTFLVTVRGTLDAIAVTVRHDRRVAVLPSLEDDENLEATDRDRIP